MVGESAVTAAQALLFLGAALFHGTGMFVDPEGQTVNTMIAGVSLDCHGIIDIDRLAGEWI